MFFLLRFLEINELETVTDYVEMGCIRGLAQKKVPVVNKILCKMAVVGKKEKCFVGLLRKSAN